jgi:3-oxoacyl-[acyl-carrier-protein] synthase III
MSIFTLREVSIAGIAAAVPANRAEVQSTPTVSAENVTKIMASTGVKARHIAQTEMCTSNLCASAAERLFERLGWERSSIDLLIFVTQTPDYILPATACSLHGRLGLSKACGAFDINLGCSGYVYGLSIAAAHVQTGAARRVLLLAGDTISKVASADDRSVAFLFGDAGTATAIERQPMAEAMHFVTGSDGTGAESLQIPAGMFRKPSSEDTRLVKAQEDGNLRSEQHLFMNGPEIFNFTIREVPAMISAVMKAAAWELQEVDTFVFHQANKFMLEYLAKRMKLTPEKVPLALENYGNTSSASIPMAICDRMGDRLREGPARFVLAGFGVGFSWAAAAIHFDRPHIEPIISVSLP